MKEKIQKVLANAGLASRREIERWVAAGRVKVNGEVIGLGERVDDSDRILVDGKPISPKSLEAFAPRVLIYNKPIGEVCSRSDPEKRPTVFQALPRLQNARWVAIGRLDINTSGLLLFTTDGALANKMMHPSAQIDREYVVRVMGKVDKDGLERLKSGVMLDDGLAAFSDVKESDNTDDDAVNRWFYCTLMEGRNREVRRLWESQGVKVNRLKRVRYGPIFLPSKAKRGSWVELEEKELKRLYEMLELPMPRGKAAPLAKRQARASKHSTRGSKNSHGPNSQTTKNRSARRSGAAGRKR